MEKRFLPSSHGEVLAEHAALQQRRLGRSLGRSNCLAASGIAGQAQDHHEHRVHRIAQFSSWPDMPIQNGRLIRAVCNLP
jgi:hypothetical protein